MNYVLHFYRRLVSELEGSFIHVLLTYVEHAMACVILWAAFVFRLAQASRLDSSWYGEVIVVFKHAAKHNDFGDEQKDCTCQT